MDKICFKYFLITQHTNRLTTGRYPEDSLLEAFVPHPNGNLTWCRHQLQKAQEFQSPAEPCRHSLTKSTRFEFAYLT